jgi:hypothetical protein
MGQVCKQAKSVIVHCCSSMEVARLDACCAPMPACLHGFVCTYPATSRVISRTKAVRLERKPVRLEILGAGVLGVTSVYFVSMRSSLFEFCGVRIDLEGQAGAIRGAG